MMFDKRTVCYSAPVGMFLLVVLSAVAPTCGEERDLTQFHDAVTPLENPHKGWYHHFPDNHPGKYEIRNDADLLEFPGMDHVYIRLAWSYLEPEEGEYNWDAIDPIIEKWTAHGLGIAFRISCRETGTDRIEQQYATPKWVIEAGAKGGYYRRGQEVGPDGPWEPVFDDPVFLVKLEKFLKAFAGRYDGKPWVRYVDIGSIGDWGEGHTSHGSQLRYGYEARKKHVDLHVKYFKKSQIVVSDDFVHSTGDPEQRRRMHEYVIDNGITYRDDSILVDWYVLQHIKTATVRSPELFEDGWQIGPTVFELQHYGAVRKDGNWEPRPGSTLAKHDLGLTGPDVFRDAVGLLHATYIGYHGYADEWLAENPKLTCELLNRCGYWYFLHRARTLGTWKSGETSELELTWENRGAAPAYHDYQLFVRLEGPETIDINLDAGNRDWLPSDTSKDTYSRKYPIRLPRTVKAGPYELKFKLYSPQAERDVSIALDDELLDDDGYYKTMNVEVVER